MTCLTDWISRFSRRERLRQASLTILKNKRECMIQPLFLPILISGSLILVRFRIQDFGIFFDYELNQV